MSVCSSDWLIRGTANQIESFLHSKNHTHLVRANHKESLLSILFNQMSRIFFSQTQVNRFGDRSVFLRTVRFSLSKRTGGEKKLFLHFYFLE